MIYYVDSILPLAHAGVTTPSYPYLYNLLLFSEHLPTDLRDVRRSKFIVSNCTTSWYVLDDAQILAASDRA